jgi:hypothetical protein
MGKVDGVPHPRPARGVLIPGGRLQAALTSPPSLPDPQPVPKPPRHRQQPAALPVSWCPIRASRAGRSFAAR